jgi:hypothetical protein
LTLALLLRRRRARDGIAGVPRSHQRLFRATNEKENIMAKKMKKADKKAAAKKAK